MKIIGFGGLSESGKSHAGKYLNSTFNIPRIKLVTILNSILEKYFPNEMNINKFHDCLYEESGYFTDFFHEKLCEHLENDYGQYGIIVIESLRNPELGEFF